MNWSDIKKSPLNNNTPRHGEIREVTRFLLIWKKIDHVTRWMETATWLEEYIRTKPVYGLDHSTILYRENVYKWFPMQWKD
jgi:hypothetical protein